MATKLIRLNDQTLIEIDVPETQARQISGGIAEKVDATLDKIGPTLLKVGRPIIQAWEELNKNFDMESAEIELGLSFEGEGNIYITKSKASANLTVRLKLRPKQTK